MIDSLRQYIPQGGIELLVGIALVYVAGLPIIILNRIAQRQRRK